jgi:nucleoside-diphosphate-sugar epimerase
MVEVAGDVGDLAVWDAVLQDADVVFHFAGQTSSVAAAANPTSDFDANVAPMRNLLLTCRRLRRRPMVMFAGTVTQAGVPLRLPVDEDAPDHPVTIYDRHKLMAEDDLKAAASDGAVCGATLRLANVYGPGGHGRNKDRDVLNRMITTALRGEPLTVYGTGDYVRDYVFVEDVVDAFLMAAARPERVNGRHYVVGSGRGITIRDAFELVAARVGVRTGTRVPVITAEPVTALSAIEQRHFVADPSRLSAATGWRPTWSLTDGIDRTIEARPCE